MTTTGITDLLRWRVGINYGFLLLWFGVFALALDWMYRLHSRWFRLSVETFDATHYAGMASYKLAILLLHPAPLLAIYLSD